MFCPRRYWSKQECVYVRVWKEKDENCYECLQNQKYVYARVWKNMMKTVSNVCNAGCATTSWTFHLRTRNRTLRCLVVMARTALSERWVATTKMETHLHFGGNFSAYLNQLHRHLYRWNRKSIHLWYNRVDSPLVDTVSKNPFPFSFHTLSV